MVEFEKWRASIAKNCRNLSAYQILEISLILRNAHVISRDQERIVFYVNNHIDWDQFNQLYDSDWLSKAIQNADAVACRLGPASIKATNLRLDKARKTSSAGP